MDSFDQVIKLLLNLLDLSFNFLGLPDIVRVLNELLGRLVHLMDVLLVVVDISL